MDIGSDQDLMRDVYMTRTQREAYERIAKNAERYLWLRDADGVEWEGAIDALGSAYRPEVIDDAIDRAMALTPNTRINAPAVAGRVE